MNNYSLIKSQNDIIKNVGNTIRITNKLLSSRYPFLIPYRKKDKWGFCTQDKEIVIDCVYDYVFKFTEGLAAVVLNNKIGFIDKSGKIVIPFIYEKGFLFKYDDFSFSDGLIFIRLNNKDCFINKDGKIAFEAPNSLFTVSKFSDGLAIAQSIYFLEDVAPAPFTFMNKKGEIVFQKSFNNAMSFSEGLAAVELAGKWGFIDLLGNVKIPFIYDGAKSYSEGLAAVKLAGKWGYIDLLGNVKIPFIFYGAKSYSEGLAPVELNAKWGFIDKSGTLLIPYLYDSANSFSEGLSQVCLNKKHGFINKFGDIIISCNSNYYIESFFNGLAAVYDRTRLPPLIPVPIKFYIDKNGKEYWED